MDINISKYIEIEKELSKEHGSFNLFALFLRQGSIDKWDLLVASNWLKSNKNRSMNQIANKLQKKLDKDELINISRIVFIEDNNPALKAIQSAINVEHGTAEVKDSNFFGLEIKHAYIITSKRFNTDQSVKKESAI